MLLRLLSSGYERQQADVPGTFDSNCQVALLALCQAGFFTRFDLAVLVDVALQGFEIFVVKICNVCAVFENLCHIVFRMETSLRLFSSRGQKRNTFLPGRSSAYPAPFVFQKLYYSSSSSLSPRSLRLAACSALSVLAASALAIALRSGRVIRKRTTSSVMFRMFSTFWTFAAGI